MQTRGSGAVAVRSRPATGRARARAARGSDRARGRAAAENPDARVFFAEFLYGGDRSFYEYAPAMIGAECVSQTAVQNSSWFGRKKLARPDFQHYFVPPSIRY